METVFLTTMSNHELQRDFCKIYNMQIFKPKTSINYIMAALFSLFYLPIIFDPPEDFTTLIVALFITSICIVFSILLTKNSYLKISEVGISESNLWKL